MNANQSISSRMSFDEEDLRSIEEIEMDYSLVKAESQFSKVVTPNCNKEPNHSIDLWPENRNLTDEDNYFLDLIIKSYENK
jgi:hypothetical protein